MKIQIDKKYSIIGDIHQWILIKRMPTKNLQIGFFSELGSLLKYYVDMRCRSSKNISTVRELIDYQKSLAESLNRALAPLKIEVLTK